VEKLTTCAVSDCFESRCSTFIFTFMAKGLCFLPIELLSWILGYCSV